MFSFILMKVVATAAPAAQRGSQTAAAPKCSTHRRRCMARYRSVGSGLRTSQQCRRRNNRVREMPCPVPPGWREHHHPIQYPAALGRQFRTSCKIHDIPLIQRQKTGSALLVLLRHWKKQPRRSPIARRHHTTQSRWKPYPGQIPSNRVFPFLVMRMPSTICPSAGPSAARIGSSGYSIR